MLAALIILSVTIVLVTIVARYYQDFLSPLGVMIAVWGIALGLYYVRLLHYVELSFETLFLMSLGYMGFVIGSLFASKVVNARRVISGEKDHLQILRNHTNQQRLFLLCSLLFLVGMVGQFLYLQRVESVIGLDSVLGDPRALHWEVAVGELKELGIVGLLASTNIVNIVVLLSYLVLFPQPRKRFLSILFMFAFTLGAVLFRTSRTGIYIPIIWAGVTFFYMRGGLKYKRRDVALFSTIIVILAAIFVGISGFLGKTDDANNLRLFWNSNLSFKPGIASVYFYVTSPLPGFQGFVEQTYDFLWGQSTFLPFYRLAKIFDPSIRLIGTVRQYVLIPQPTNVFTYLAPFYEDFGYFGTLLLPLSLGFLATYLYIASRAKNILALIFVSSLITTTMFWSAFQSIQIFIIIWYYAFVVILVGKLSEKSDRDRAEGPSYKLKRRHI